MHGDMHAPAPAAADDPAATPPWGAWVFTGDTGPNPALWARLAQIEVAALIVETAFGDDELALARISRHLSPVLLESELQQLQAPTAVYITHIKPGEVDAVMSEIGAHRSHHRISALVSGQKMQIGG
jgi:ribonuclease BN (tRNA processing enzyme)